MPIHQPAIIVVRLALLSTTTGMVYTSTAFRLPPVAAAFTASPPAHHTVASASPLTAVPGHRRGYATAVPPATEKKKLALIGTRGYTGQALLNLLPGHPSLELTHVSSRQLAGQELGTHTADPGLRYSNLSPADVQQMEQSGEVDAWVLALPNGKSAPFVDGIKQGKGRGVVVDLGADYRFEPKGASSNVNGWVYGLPGEQAQL